MRKPLLTVAVSSRALFHLEAENHFYNENGDAAYDRMMSDKARDVLAPGAAFPMVRKLLALNELGQSPLVEVVLLSRNSALSGERIMNSVIHYGLPIDGAVLTGGGDCWRYAHALNADLFLSAKASDVGRVLASKMAAATVVPRASEDDGELSIRIAVDGDSVLFSGEADAVYREHGLDEFHCSESEQVDIPLGAGPFKSVVTKLCALQAALGPDSSRLRIALVTARGVEAHGRALRTLNAWGLQLDEVVFAAGRDKGPLLAAFGADIVFDDDIRNIEAAARHDVVAGHVPTEVKVGAPTSPAARTTEQPVSIVDLNSSSTTEGDTSNASVEPSRVSRVRVPSREPRVTTRSLVTHTIKSQLPMAQVPQPNPVGQVQSSPVEPARSTSRPRRAPASTQRASNPF